MEKIYQVVTTCGATYFTREELEQHFTVTGFNESTRTREELYLEPVLKGVLGPMYNGTKDGVTCIRYESQQAYNFYSA